MNAALMVLMVLGVIVTGLCALTVIVPCLAVVAFMVWLLMDPA
jgi:hypothetical protein